MAVYPLTQSQYSDATSADALGIVKSPELLARRLSEILNAQNFLSLFLLTGRYRVNGGAIAVPRNENFRTERNSRVVAPGAEYPLTPMNDNEWSIYQSMKFGIATEITDEEIGRSAMQPVEDAMQFLRTELMFEADEVAMDVINASVTNTYEGGVWESGKDVFATATGIRAQVRRDRLGFDINTAVLPSEMYAAVQPMLLDILPMTSEAVLRDEFPTINGITWVSDDTGALKRPLFLDRNRLGGIARENIPSEGYVGLGNDTGVEIKSFTVETADKQRIQARNPHVPVVVNPEAAVFAEGVTI